MLGRHGSAASRATSSLRNRVSSALAREGSFLVALTNACRIFARLTRPTILPPSTIGTRLIRLRSSIAAISPSGVSGLAVMTSLVITSATLRRVRFDVLSGKRTFIRQKLEPPGMSFARAGLRPPYQIAFAHDTDKLAFLA